MKHTTTLKTLCLASALAALSVGTDAEAQRWRDRAPVEDADEGCDEGCDDADEESADDEAEADDADDDRGGRWSRRDRRGRWERGDDRGRDDRRGGRQDDARDEGDDEDAAQGDDEGQGADDGADAEAEPAPRRSDAEAPAASGGRTYGIFVGISQYGGDNSDLDGPAADAVNLARAFQRSGQMPRANAVVLTDGQGTLTNVRQAFRTMAARVTPQDTLVFFFDGHGGASVLDLVGANLSRRELGRLMATVRGRQLVVLDSCHAGGFAPVVQGRPERAGLFSSRSDQESSTAPEVNAGGWLAYFFRRAVEGEVRPRADGSLDFGAVTQYVRRQYDQRGVTRSQELVAVAAQRDFAIGGSGDAVASAEPTVVVARRDAPTQPAMQPSMRPWPTGGGVTQPTAAPSMQPSMRPWPGAVPSVGPLFGDGDGFAQVIRAATRGAGAMRNLVK
jgi:hypothetical protein